MSRARTYPIDGNRLKNLILTTGITLAEASERLGGSKDYLAGVCRTNKATAQCMSLIALALSIPKDLYAIEEKKEEVVTNESDGDPQSIIELLQAIKKSVEKIEKYIEEKSYEQKTFNLPFGDPVDCGSTDDRLG